MGATPGYQSNASWQCLCHGSPGVTRPRAAMCQGIGLCLRPCQSVAGPRRQSYAGEELRSGTTSSHRGPWPGGSGTISSFSSMPSVLISKRAGECTPPTALPAQWPSESCRGLRGALRSGAEDRWGLVLLQPSSQPPQLPQVDSQPQGKPCTAHDSHQDQGSRDHFSRSKVRSFLLSKPFSFHQLPNHLPAEL